MASVDLQIAAAPVPPTPLPPGLPPLVEPAIERLITENPDRLRDLVATHGSPLHLVFPHTVATNTAGLQAVLERQGVDHAIYYGAKANKSCALVAAAVAAGAGVDVSSLAEFRDAVRAGATPDRICATGPAKSMAFLRALVEAGALIAVDSLEELDDIVALAPAGAGERAIRILLRYRPTSTDRSRFGMERGALAVALERVATRDSVFRLEGFHFHLGGYDPETRVVALRELVPLIEIARMRGLDPRTIDIGGGLPVRYVEPELYEAYLTAQAPWQYRTGRVPRSFYPYGGRVSAADWLERFLSATPMVGTTVAAFLRSRSLTLALEPGRSLVDQSAISLFRITRVKALGGDERVIFVEGSSFSACETWFSSEFLVEPILVPGEASGAEEGARPVRAFVAGHSCLDEDVLTHRLIRFDREPRAGDLMIWANTAGYQMDLLENEFHRHPAPVRLTATVGDDGAFHFARDI